MTNKVSFEYIAKRGIDYEYTPIIAALVNDGGRYTPVTNYLKNSGFDDNSAWSISAVWTIENGVAKNHAGASQTISQTVTLDVGIYLVSVEIVEAITGNFSLYGSAGTATTTFLTSAYQKYTLGILARLLQVTSGGTITLICRADNGTVGSIDNFTCYYLNDDTIGNDASTNLVTNGDFPTTTTGWTKYETSGTGAISVVSAQLLVDNAGSATYTRAVQGITCTVGKSYEATCDLIGVSNFALLTISTGSTGVSQIAVDRSTTTGTLRINFVATASTMYIGVWSGSGTSDTATFDNVVCRASNDLITNGEFGTDISWTKGTGWTISGYVAVATAATGTLQQVVTFEETGTYELHIKCASLTSGNFYLTLVPGTAIVTYETAILITATGEYYRKVYVHSTGTMTYSILPSSAFTGTLDNASFWLIEDDQSASNDNGFEVHGQLRRVAVNQGSDLRAYAGFSATAYLEQPYTSALDFGSTGDFSVVFWSRWDSFPSGAFHVFENLTDDGNTGFRAYANGNAAIVWQIRNTAAASTLTSANNTFSPNIWYHVVLTRETSGTILKAYINGEYNSTSGTITARNTDSGAPLTIGTQSNGLSNYHHGYIANFQIYNSALTAAQIKNLYDTEKEQFRPFSAFQQKDNTYLIETTANHKLARVHREKWRNVALDGTTESNLIREDKTHDIQTDLIHYQDMAPWREMMFSLGSDETFNFRIGSGFEPNEQITASIDSADYEEVRENETIYHRLNLTVRER